VERRRRSAVREATIEDVSDILVGGRGDAARALFCCMTITDGIGQAGRGLRRRACRRMTTIMYGDSVHHAGRSVEC